VNYLHSSSPPIIHRDLKPGNIFISDGRDGNYIKIGDFGTATSHGDESFKASNKTPRIEHTLEIGTYKYMAPEVLISKGYNQKCDIYSLGCIAMDLLCINW
jgi:serine/threonine protein kinase